MKAACFTAVNQVEMLEIEDPIVELPTDAIVKVSTAGLCGSDLHAFHGREPGMDRGTAMGHEFVGEVIAVGNQVSNVSVGARVASPFSTSCGLCVFCKSGLTSRCVDSQLFGWRSDGDGLHGGQAELVRVPNADGTLVEISNNISDVQALLLGDNLSTGFYCADMAGIESDGVYVVIGCGTVGLCAIQSAIARKAKSVFAIDMLEHRRELAKSMGAVDIHPDNATDVIAAATNGLGANAVLELVGLPAAQEMAYRLLRPGGTMSVIGCHCTDTFAFSPVAAYDKNLTYRTGRCPARYYMEKLIEPVTQGEFQLESLVTHRFSIEDSTHAYEVFSQRLENCVKAVIEFQ